MRTLTQALVGLHAGSDSGIPFAAAAAAAVLLMPVGIMAKAAAVKGRMRAVEGCAAWHALPSASYSTLCVRASS